MSHWRMPGSTVKRFIRGRADSPLGDFIVRARVGVEPGKSDVKPAKLDRTLVRQAL